MREGIRLPAGLIAGSLALLPLTAASAGTGSNLCAAPGGSLVVVNADQTGSASGQSVPIAFNSQDGEFLVTWDINADGGPRSVYVQRVAADGSLVGDNNVILEGPEPDIFFTPAVAYSPANNHYFVASQFQGGPPGTPDFNNGLGRLVSAAGEPASDIVRLSPAGLEGTLVFNPVSGEFLHHGRNFDGGGDPGIYLRRIGGDGAPVGEPTPIATVGNPAPAGDVEVNAATGAYLSTWRDQDVGALKGRLLDGDGAPLGEPFVISNVFPPFNFASSVAYDPIGDQYLVVFSGFSSPSPLFGQFVDASGELIGSPFTLVDGDIQLPRIAYDPVHEVYLITWVDGGIWVQLLSRQGEELGEPQQLTPSVGFAASGWAAANENVGGFLVSWLQADGTHVAVRLVDVIDECGVTVDPETVDFGDQEVGTTSSPQTVLVGNPGSTDLDLGTLMLGGDDPGDYAIVDDTCSGQLLTPGETCTFDVTFTPLAAFTRVARVEIPSDAPVSPNTVDLRGNGLGAVVAVTPLAVDFGDVEVGQTSPPAAGTVENVGSADLEIGDLALSGEQSDAFSLVSDGCSGVTVPAGGSCTFEVTFMPSALGTHTAAVEIPSNAPSSPDVVALQGEGVPTSPDIQADPESLSSTLPEGSTETHDLTISNLGDTTLEWEVTEAGGLADGMPLAGRSRAHVSLAPASTVAAKRGSLTFYDARGDFQTANPGLILEDFADTNAPPNDVTSCSPPFNSDTNNACFSPGDIAPGLSMDVTLGGGKGGAVVLTPPFAGVPCVSVGPNEFLDHADWDFDPRVRAVGFDLQSNEAGQIFTVTVFGPGGVLGSADVTTAGPGSPVFFGVDTADTQGISRIEVRGQDAGGELFCDVEFGGDPVDCTLPDWVSVDPTNGSVAGGGSQLVAVIFDATGLAPGDYAANLCLASNDPDTPTLPVPLTLAVEEPNGETDYTPVALVVDPEIEASDGNGIFEPGEQVDVAPSWRNDGETAQSLLGAASNFTGPEGADYVLAGGSADYGLVEPGAVASCLDVGVCYQLGIDDPAERPATHWEATFDETLDDAEATAKTWSLHVGDSFTDVPRTDLFYPATETLLHHGVTGGCTATEYCPAGSNTRGQMAVFLLKAAEGASYVPPACVEGEEVFDDVPFDDIFCPWIEELAGRGITAGCGGGNYCPSASVSRDQMAVFLLKALEGAGYTPPACSGEFSDVPCPSLFAAWIEELAARGVTAGCGGSNYCPAAPVSRGQMAVFVTKTFGLTLYGP